MYIIDTKWFYFLNLLDKLSVIITAIFIIMAITTFSFILYYIYWRYFEYSEKCERDVSSNKTAKKCLTCCVIITLISCLLFVFIPDKKTIEEMIVSNVITTENIDKTKDDVKEIVDYVIDSIEKVEKDK